MYKTIKREYDLTTEEQEKAQFILSNCDNWNSQQARGTLVNIPERQAFELFKITFYQEVWRRLFGTTPMPALDIGRKGKTIIWFGIEKETKVAEGLAFIPQATGGIESVRTWSYDLDDKGPG